MKRTSLVRKPIMLNHAQRRFPFVLFFCLLFVFSQEVLAQSSDAIEATYSITVNQNRTGTVQIKMISPPTAAGFLMLCNPNPKSYPKEWNVIATATPTKNRFGLGCIVNTQMEFSSIDMLRKQLAYVASFATTEEGNELLISSKGEKNPYPFQFRINVKIIMPKILSYTTRETLGTPIKSDNSISMSFMNTVVFEVRGVLGNKGAGQEIRPYLGCWSTPKGNVLYITLTTIQFPNKGLRLSYEEVFNDVARNLYLLKLAEGDESGGYMSLVVVADEMKLNGYASYDDFLNGKSYVQSTWNRADCNKVLSRLKEK